MKSIWIKDVKKPSFEALSGELQTDVLIIGGGICGILCAYLLKQAGVSCVLVEEGEICGGITAKTTAKITVQHGLIYNKIIRKYGEEKAKLYYESQKNALEKYQEIASQIDCDFKPCDSFVYSLRDRAMIEKEVEALQKIGCKADFCEEPELPFQTFGAVKIKGQAQFHPLKFAYALAKDLPILEHTKVLNLKSNTAITSHGNIFAKKIVVATHFPFLNRYGGYFLKLYQHRSYVLALENAPDVQNMYVDEQTGGLSFRSHRGVLLLGGASHRTGRQGSGWKALKQFQERYYPNAKEVARWATQDCMSLDAIPYIGQYSKLTPDIYVATGFNKWGMTSSMVSAMVLTDLICKGDSVYREVYSPERTMLHSQLALNIFESLKGLATPTVPRCPHMGCALKYNKQEHSWDCPCHGSRFGEDGKLIDNPAKKNQKQLGTDSIKKQP